MEAESLERVLGAHPFLAGLEEAHVRFMTGCAKNVRAEAGEYLFREGEDANAVYLVRAGRVALEVHVPGRGALTLETIEEGDVLGWSWILPPFRSALDARAVEAVRAIAFDRRCLAAKMDADHDLGYALALRLLAEAHRRLERARLLRLDLYRAEP